MVEGRSEGGYKRWLADRYASPREGVEAVAMDRSTDASNTCVGLGPGFRKRSSCIARSLLETGGPQPRPHPQSSRACFRANALTALGSLGGRCLCEWCSATVSPSPAGVSVDLG